MHCVQDVKPIMDAIHGAKRPVLYVGGGCLDAAMDLREFVAATGIPVAQTLMGLGAFPETHPLALQVPRPSGLLSSLSCSPSGAACR